jgi:hypothetical protein
MPCYLYRKSIFAFEFGYDANGNAITAGVDGHTFTFEYTGKNITKINRPDIPNYLTVKYNPSGKPISAKKTFNFPDFQLVQDYVVKYEGDKVKTMTITITRDLNLTLTHRLEYNQDGNLTKHYLKQDNLPEYVFAENIGFDNKKNPFGTVNLNPLILFYEPGNLFYNQPKNNPIYSKIRANTPDWYGTFNSDETYHDFTYTKNGYLRSAISDFRFEYIDPEFGFIDEQTLNYEYRFACDEDNARKVIGATKSINSKIISKISKLKYLKFR